jgi:hypothetical protein
MRLHRATLIQDIYEYKEILRPYLDPLMEPYTTHGISEESTLHWILAEELELIYGLFDESHEHNCFPYVQIHNQLSGLLPYPLSVLTANYVRAPKLYNPESFINLELVGRDLHIKYFAPPTNFLQRQQLWISR